MAKDLADARGHATDLEQRLDRETKAKEDAQSKAADTAQDSQRKIADYAREAEQAKQSGSAPTKINDVLFYSIMWGPSEQKHNQQAVNQLFALVKNQQPFNVSPGFFQIDPLPGVGKTCVILWGYNTNELRVLTLKEGVSGRFSN